MLNHRGHNFKTLKQQGEWAQLLFMARAAEMGLAVSQPYGDSSSYDVGIEHGGRLLRVQVKSTTYCRSRSYTCNVVGPKHQRYPAGCVDFFAIYLVPIDLWYIIPFEATGSTSLQFTPEMKGQKYQRYMEAWHLLRGEGKRGGSG
jgi:PD-(D/E)XK nuclease superfamily protein